MKIKNLLWASCLILLVLACLGTLAYPLYLRYSRGSELGRAYERYLTKLMDAQLGLDPSHLAEVAVNPRLEAAIKGIEERKGFSEAVSEEFSKVEVITIIRYSESEAIIEVRYNYRPFSQDFKTGQRVYGPTGRWYWRVERIVLEKDDGTWKVREVHFLDWSG